MLLLIEILLESQLPRKREIINIGSVLQISTHVMLHHQILIDRFEIR